MVIFTRLYDKKKIVMRDGMAGMWSCYIIYDDTEMQQICYHVAWIWMMHLQ